MYIILDKPSLSFKKQAEQLPGKQITIYTNELQSVSRNGLIKHLVANNKLSAFSSTFSVTTMSEFQKQKFSLNVYLRTADLKSNPVVDLLLQNNQNILNYKIDFPIIMMVKIISKQNIINSQTKHLSLQKNFNILSKIGQGSFAEIYLARQQGTQYLRAIKVIDKQRCNRIGELSYIQNQYNLLKQIVSPWLIQFFYAFEDKKNVYFVTQFCCYGDLYTEINRKFREMTITKKYMYWIQIAFQICQLHQKGFLYRDLKPQNILIDYRGNAKLCDFGFTIKYQRDQLIYDLCGSYEYLAPQLVNKQGYNTSFDIYCLGLLLYQLLTGSNPYKGITSKNLQEINNRKIELQIQGIFPQTKDLLKKLLERDPKKRIGYKDSMQIFKHQFFVQNKELVVKILKNQRIQSKQATEVVIKNMIARKQTKNQQQQNKAVSKSLLFQYDTIYNYLTPNFDITDKSGPKMVPSDNKGKIMQ